MLASWNYCKIHDIIYVPSTQPCPVCLQEENTRLIAELKGLNIMALVFKNELRVTRDRCQEIRVEASERREEMARTLGIDTECENWWDTSGEEKDEQILGKARVMMVWKYIMGQEKN